MRNVRGHPVQNCVRGKYSAQVVGHEVERLAAGVFYVRRLEYFPDAFADRRRRYGSRMAAVVPLEQQRSRRGPASFGEVIEGDQWNGSVLLPNSGDDRGYDIGQLRTDDEEAFLVGLGRRDVQQRDDLPCLGVSILDDAVMARFEHLLDPDAGVPKKLDCCPTPEGTMVLGTKVAAAAGRVEDARNHTEPLIFVSACGDSGEGLAEDGERLAGFRIQRCVQSEAGLLGAAFGGPHQNWQQGQAFAGPLVHARLSARIDLPGRVRGFRRADGARNGPSRPSRRILGSPLRDVQVERPDCGQELEVVHPWDGDLDGGPVRQALILDLDAEAFFPRMRHFRVEVERVDAWMV